MSGRKELLEFMAARGWTRVGQTEWAEVRKAFPKVTVAALLKVGIRVEQPVRGVEQHGFDELERSLVELAEVYAAQPDVRRFAREQVIAAKERARWASRNLRAGEDVQRRKAEMVEWMLVWLDDPAMFETWVRLRRRAVETGVHSDSYAEKNDPESQARDGCALMPFVPDVSGEDREKCDVCGGSGDCAECKGTGNGGQCFNCAGTGNCPQCQGTGLRKKKTS